MPNATLATIDVALNTALAALVTNVTTGTTVALPFAVCARYAGPVTRKGLQNVCREQFPAVLLRFDGEADARGIDTWGGDSEEVGDASWSVIVVAEDPREIDDGMLGNTTVPGALRLIDSALGAVNALLVADTYQGRHIRAVETRPELIEDGVVYAFGTRLVARRVLPQATNTDPAAALPYVQPMIGGLDLQTDSGDAANVNPLVSFQADPNP